MIMGWISLQSINLRVQSYHLSAFFLSFFFLHRFLFRFVSLFNRERSFKHSSFSFTSFIAFPGPSSSSFFRHRILIYVSLHCIMIAWEVSLPKHMVYKHPSIHSYIHTSSFESSWEPALITRYQNQYILSFSPLFFLFKFIQSSSTCTVFLTLFSYLHALFPSFFLFSLSAFT